jgi:hypothetical protein
LDVLFAKDSKSFSNCAASLAERKSGKSFEKLLYNLGGFVSFGIPSCAELNRARNPMKIALNKEFKRNNLLLV